MPRSGSRRWAAQAKSDAQFAMKQPLASAHISSAALQKVKELKTAVAMPEGWQRDAYGYYLTIGELAQVLTETASAVARCELRPIESSDEAVPGGYRRSTDERVLRVWEAFQGARGGQSELIRRAALNLQIAGEVLLVGIPMKDQFGGDAGYEWNFLSCDEIRLESNGTVKRNYGYAGKPPVELPMDTYIARLWRSCPQYEERADCAVKHVLPICQEVILLTQVVDAIAKCVDDETEILTTNGWRCHDQIKVGDEVLALDHETGLASWQPLEAINRYDRVDHPMLSIEAMNHSSLTTLNHRWPVLSWKSAGRAKAYDHTKRTWKRSDQLTGRDRILTAAPVADLPTEPKYTDAFVEMMAWFWTEGYARNGQISITQSYKVNPHKTGSIRRALTALYGPGVESMRATMVGGKTGSVARSGPMWRESTHNDKGCVVFHLNTAASAPFLEIAPNKIVDMGFIRSLTQAQLNLYIEKSIDADGTRTRTGGTRIIFQNSKERLEPMDLACILAGHQVRRSETTDHLGGPLWGLHIWSTTEYAVRDREVVNYTGTVWCPTTPTGTWLARRRGTTWWTGNSRLSAGIIYVPDEMSFGPMDETEDDSDEIDEIDPFSQELMEQMTAPVEDRTSAASLVPLIMRGPAEYADKVKMIELARNLDHMYQDLRLEAIKRLATGLDVPVEIMFGKGGLNHWPCRAETEIYTQRGWKSYLDIESGDYTLTLNHSTGLSSWSPIQDVPTFEVVDEPMIHLTGRGHESTTTLSHRWPIIDNGDRLWVRADEIKNSDQIVRSAPSEEIPITPTFKDAFVELVAWYSADGTQIGTTPQVRIGKSHDQNPQLVSELDRIFRDLFGDPFDGVRMPTGSTSEPSPETLDRFRLAKALRAEGLIYREIGERMGVHQVEARRYALGEPSFPDYTPRWRIDVQDRGMTIYCPNKWAIQGLLEQVPGKEKIIPTDFVRALTVNQLELFLRAWSLSDGSVRDPNDDPTAFTVHQGNLDRLQAVELAALLLGRSVSWSKREWDPTDVGRFSKDDLHCIRISKNSLTRPSHIETISYTGTIFCLATPPNRSWLARDNGKVFFTGNTGYNIDSDFITKHIIPIGDMIAEFITTAYLRPMLVTYEGMTEEEAHEFRLYFDASKITSRSDAGQSALAAYDRRELSAVSFVRESGLSESDMPTRDERKERDLRSLMAAEPLSFGPQVMGMLYPELDGVIEVPVAPMDGTDNPAALPGPADGLPQRKNPTGPNSDPLIDNETGQGEPTPRNQAGPRLDEASLVRAIASLGDAALEEALEAAGSRIMGSMTGTLPVKGDRDRIRTSLGQVHFSAMPSALSEMDKRAVGVNATFLSQMALDSFAEVDRKVAGLLERHLVGGGLEGQRAKDLALHASAIYVNVLEAHLATALLHPLRPEANGLSVPDAFVRQALLQAKITI